jgi:hypothetical protein
MVQGVPTLQLLITLQLLTVVAQKSKYRTASASLDGHADSTLQQRVMSLQGTDGCKRSGGVGPERIQAELLTEHATRL